MGNCHCGVCRLEAITRVANALRGEPQRRKIVFFIGERFRLAPVPGPCNSYLEPATKAMVRATQLANVTVTRSIRTRWRRPMSMRATVSTRERS